VAEEAAPGVAKNWAFLNVVSPLDNSFTVAFYGLKILCRKTAQFCATRREYLTTETPSTSDAVQCSENERKNSFLNYESVALSA
jgi:hypothetical protein